MSGRDLSETVKNWATVIAMVGAAVWAGYTFRLKEIPGLELKANASK